jgi:hypothetical protein
MCEHLKIGQDDVKADLISTKIIEVVRGSEEGWAALVGWVLTRH